MGTTSPCSSLLTAILGCRAGAAARFIGEVNSTGLLWAIDLHRLKSTKAQITSVPLCGALRQIQRADSARTSCCISMHYVALRAKRGNYGI